MNSQTEPKRFIVSWDQFHRDSKALAWRLLEKAENKEWKGIIAVTRGGMIPAGIIARELDIKTIETIGIFSYDGEEVFQHEIKILKTINIDIVGNGEGWLVIDDLVDSGNTIRAIKEIIPKAHIATVYAKPAGEPEVNTYVTWVSQDTWIYFPWDVDIQPIEPIALSKK